MKKKPAAAPKKKAAAKPAARPDRPKQFRSTTASNSQEGKKRGKGKPFVKGDERINRNGRPSTFDDFRELAIDMAKEPMIDKQGKPVKFPGTDDILSRSKAILLQWAQSTDIRKQEKFIEYAFGKVPQKNDLTVNPGPDLYKNFNDFYAKH
jgi:hypothetical protein